MASSSARKQCRRRAAGPLTHAASSRRFLLAETLRRGTAGASIILAGNLLGATSRLLSATFPELARSLRLDAIYPVLGLKRCIGSSFEFVFPQSWLADQTIARERALRREEQSGLVLPSLSRRRSPLPSAAFGPPGTQGETNVSVIVSPGSPLGNQTFDDPLASGQSLLSRIVPQSSGLSAHLIRAEQRKNRYLDLEYTVEGSNFKRHNRRSALFPYRYLTLSCW
jgi:hypothetical protein